MERASLLLKEQSLLSKKPKHQPPKKLFEDVSLSREEVVSLIAKAVAEAKKEFSSQIEERDAKITELSKQAAPSISRAPKMEVKAPVNLTELSMKERIAAIQNQFSL